MTMTTTMNDDESRVYYDLHRKEAYAGANAGMNKLFPKTATKWLSTQPAYSLHKDLAKKFSTRKYKVGAINELWQADLLEMIPYAKVNKGNKYILTVIDVFTRKAMAVPLKSKTGVDVKNALMQLMKNVKPLKLQTDQGKEFYNSSVKALLTSKGVQHYSVYSKQKCAIVERFNRTLRTKLNRYFTHMGNKVWYDILPTVINTYNNTPHSSLMNYHNDDGLTKEKLSPNEVNMENGYSIWYNREMRPPKPTATPREGSLPVKIGEYCRVSRDSGAPFMGSKNFDQNWSEEIFRIVGIDKRDVPTMYFLQDLDGEVIEGKFYKQELQVIAELPKTYRIEKIIRSKGSGVHKQHLVKWYGYKEPSWIPAANIVKPSK